MSREKQELLQFYERFDKLLTNAQMIQKKSLRQIAKESGVSINTLSAYKSKKTIPDVTNLVRLAYYFGVSTDYLLGREGYELENENNGNWFYPRALLHNGDSVGIGIYTPMRLDKALEQFDIWIYSGYVIDENWLQTIDGRRIEVEKRWVIKEGDPDAE